MEGRGEDPAAGVVQAAAAGQRPLGFALVGAAAVGVAGDHVGAVDPQAASPSRRRLDAAGEDRGGGDVGVEVRVQQAVDRPDPGREAGAGGGARAGAAPAPPLSPASTFQAASEGGAAAARPARRAWATP